MRAFFEVVGDVGVGAPAVVEGDVAAFAAEFGHAGGHERAVVWGEGAVGDDAAVNVGVKQDEEGEREGEYPFEHFSDGLSCCCG